MLFQDYAALQPQDGHIALAPAIPQHRSKAADEAVWLAQLLRCRKLPGRGHVTARGVRWCLQILAWRPDHHHGVLSQRMHRPWRCWILEPARITGLKNLHLQLEA
jgi:hypothetical protein